MVTSDTSVIDKMKMAAFIPQEFHPNVSINQLSVINPIKSMILLFATQFVTV